MREEVRINPRRCDAHYNLGRILLERRQYAQALPPLDRALECYGREGRNPHYIADAHNNLALAYAGLGRYPEAESHLRALLGLMPNYPGGREALDLVLASQAVGNPAVRTDGR
jgi:tetratricopeptide (TPR) repeat protein